MVGKHAKKTHRPASKAIMLSYFSSQTKSKSSLTQWTRSTARRSSGLARKSNAKAAGCETSACQCLWRSSNDWRKVTTRTMTKSSITLLLTSKTQKSLANNPAKTKSSLLTSTLMPTHRDLKTVTKIYHWASRSGKAASSIKNTPSLAINTPRTKSYSIKRWRRLSNNRRKWSIRW